MTNFDPSHIATADQWLASLDEQIAEPLQNVRRILADSGGDKSKAFLRVSRMLIAQLEHGSTDFRINVGMSYASTLFMLNEKGAGQ